MSIIESEESYISKKYFKWVRHGFKTPQEADPTFIPCSFCGRRTPNLKLHSTKHRDYLVCEHHDEYKRD